MVLHDMARSQWGSFIRQEETSLAMNDAFLLGSFVFGMLAAFAWLARSTVLPPIHVEKLREPETEKMLEQA